MHSYTDPTSATRRRPNLIEGLTRYAPTKLVVQGENQVTEALAWLLDRSPHFARAFARLCLHEGDAEALSAVEAAHAFGAATQIALPHPEEPGRLWPDLALAGDSRLFEVLVEVKLGADPHAYPSEDEVLLQPEMYRRAWDKRSPGTEARVRRVATLTKGFDFGSPSEGPRAGRGRDVTWNEVRDELARLDADGQLGDVLPVARDFLDVVEGRIVRRELPPYTDALLVSAEQLLRRVFALVESAIDASWREPPRRRTDYTGGYVQFRSIGSEHELWIFVTPQGGQYNRFGQGDAVGISVFEAREKRFEEEGRLLPGGFVREPDFSGYRDDRIYVDLPSNEGVIEDVESTATEIATTIVKALRSCRPPFVH